MNCRKYCCAMAKKNSINISLNVCAESINSALVMGTMVFHTATAALVRISLVPSASIYHFTHRDTYASHLSTMPFSI